MWLKKKESNAAITYIYQIIQQNNIKFGHSQYGINKKINLYILNKKYDIEFFNTIDFKNILYRIFLYVKTIYQVHNQKSLFLFASTNPIYNEILRTAAVSATMIVHNTRWTCGTISRRTNLNLLKGSTDQTFSIQKQRIINSLLFFLDYKKTVKNDYTASALIGIFIPDLENNTMIVKEALIKNIPIIGIVNSNCNVEVDYPIFGNDKSVFSVFFFSHLIAYWIRINLKKYRGINKFYVFNKKKKNNIMKSIKNKITLFKLFKKSYIRKIYRFGRRFAKSRNTHISLFLFGIHNGEFELNNYKKKWFTQKYQRELNNDLFFPYKNFLNLRQRLTLLNNLLLNNHTGTMALSRRFLGNFFWFNLRPLLLQKRRQIYKQSMSKNLLWVKSIFLGKKKHNYKFNKRNKKRWHKPITVKKNNYKFNRQNTKQLNKSFFIKNSNHKIKTKDTKPYKKPTTLAVYGNKTTNTNKKQWKGPTIGKNHIIKKK